MPYSLRSAGEIIRAKRFNQLSCTYVYQCVCAHFKLAFNWLNSEQRFASNKVIKCHLCEQFKIERMQRICAFLMENYKMSKTFR